jgi:tRNA pseudouridine38-40 synthase
MKNSVYHLNAILPEDIVIKRITKVLNGAHCRFDALSREYEYSIYKKKNPFLRNRAYYFPFPLNIERMMETAEIIRLNENFQSFSKKNTQVHTYVCNIEESYWKQDGDLLIYKVKGSRFLRGIVRGLVGTMLKVGTNKLNTAQFQSIIDSNDCSKVDFSSPAHGLTLVKVNYNKELFQLSGK